MGKTATNLSIVLGLITVAFAGYYMYSQRDDAPVNFDADAQTRENVLNDARVIIGHRETLKKVEIDTNFFEDRRYKSLRSFRTPIKTQPIGRQNPFADINTSQTSSF